MKGIKIALLLSYISLASFSAAIITPALPIIQKSYAISNGELSWLVSIFLMAYVIGQLLYGPVANAKGRLYALRLGLGINIIGVFFCIGAYGIHNYALLLIGRFITALGASAGLVCTLILINELLDEKQAKSALAYTSLSFTGSIAVAVFVGGVLTQYLGVMSCFIFLLLHGFLMTAFSYCFTETLKTPRAYCRREIMQNYLKAVSNKTLLLYSFVVGGSASVSYCLAVVAPLIASQWFSLNPSQFGLWNLVNMTGMFSTGFVAKYIMSRYTPQHGIYLGIIVCIIIFILLKVLVLFNVLTTSIFFIITSFLYLFSGVLFPCGSFYATRAIEDKASSASMLSFINMTSAAISVMVLGYLPFALLNSFIITILSLFTLVILLRFYFRSQQDWFVQVN